MRYRLTARADGKITLAAAATIDKSDIRVEFAINDENVLQAIATSKHLDEGQFRATYGKRTTTDRQVTFDVDPAVLSETLEVMRGIESHLAFASDGALARLDWESIRHELVPETEEERKSAQVFAIEIKEGFERKLTRLDKRALEYIVNACSTHRASIIPKSFWREAHNEYLSLRFIQAFYNFYFIIEGYFGRGKSGEAAVLAAFAKSAELQENVAGTIDVATKDQYHWPKLLELCREEKCEPDILGIQKLLVRLRGRLHHFSLTSSKAGPVAFNQRLFFSPAWFAEGIAVRTILSRDVTMAQCRTFSASQFSSSYAGEGRADPASPTSELA